VTSILNAHHIRIFEWAMRNGMLKRLALIRTRSAHDQDLR
jgi:hypothetical protein